jgi:amino acid transporter
VLTPGFFTATFFADLGALYVFGSLLCFAFAHLAILGLRMKSPDLPRPFKLAWNIRLKGRELPITTLLGLIATTAIWIVVVVTQPYSRQVGIGWMIAGLIIYCFYRLRARLPLTHVSSLSGPEHGHRAQSS